MHLLVQGFKKWNGFEQVGHDVDVLFVLILHVNLFLASFPYIIQ
jgi:hypothetical protein